MNCRVLIELIFIFAIAAICASENEQNPLAKTDTSTANDNDDSDMYMEDAGDHEQSASSFENQASSGSWFPSFSGPYPSYDQPPLGHSRPLFYNTYHQQEGAYSQRQEPHFKQDIGFNPGPKYVDEKKYNNKENLPSSAQSVSLLGDGNFGVIQGGTFYPEKDNYESETTFDDFNVFFRNGHGRPSYFYPSNPKPGLHAQFENFKDFADINTTPERQYSQYVVVYTNKNGTRTSAPTNQPPTSSSNTNIPNTENNMETQQKIVTRPRNILESLALLDNLDKVPVPAYDQGSIIEIPPEKKQSKSKRKLAKLLPEKKFKARLLQKEKEMSEPLLALS